MSSSKFSRKARAFVRIGRMDYARPNPGAELDVRFTFARERTRPACLNRPEEQGGSMDRFERYCAIAAIAGFLLLAVLSCAEGVRGTAPRLPQTPVGSAIGTLVRQMI